MKKIFFILFILPVFCSAQIYQNMPQYGYTTERFKATSVLQIPSDTVTNKLGIARIGTVIYVGNGTYWTAPSGSSSGWGLTGNASTVAGTNFLGTTDAVDLWLNTNGVNRLIIPSGGIASSTASDDSILVTKTDGVTMGKIAKGALIADTTGAFINNVTSVNDSTIRVYKGALQTDLLIRGNETKIVTRNIDYINTPTFSALTGYTAVGSPTYSFGGGKVIFTGVGGADAYTKYIKNDLKVLNECNTLSSTITLDAAPSASSYGVAIGFNTYNIYCATVSVMAGIVTATGANFGKLYIYGNYGAQLNYGATNTDLNNGDVIKLTLTHYQWQWKLVVQNYTQGWIERMDIETSDGGFVPILGHNSSNTAFYHKGGNISLDSFRYTINAPANMDIMFVGNSITYGQDATYMNNRWINLVGNIQDNVFSGGGCDVSQDIVDRLPEIVAIHPARVLLHDIAGNDIAQAISSVTWNANLITIRNTLIAAGIEVVWTNGQPRTGLDETAQKTFIEATFTGDLIINTWTPMLGTGTDANVTYMSDATHPNNKGMIITANAVNGALGFPKVGETLNNQIKFGSSINTDTSSANLTYSVPTNRVVLDSGSIQFTSEVSFSNSAVGSISAQGTGLTLRAKSGSGLAHDFMLYDLAGNGILSNPHSTANLVTQFNLGVGMMGVATPDSNLTVNSGTWLKRGVRMSGLPSGVAAKRVMADATGNLYVSDSTAGGGSTYTASLPIVVTGTVISADTTTANTGLTSLYQNSLKLSTATAASTYLPLVGATYTTTSGNGLDLTTSTLTTGNLMKLTNTSTVNNGAGLLSIVSSGANGTASKTTYGQKISVTNTGTTSTNVGLSVTASGATNNYAIQATGNILSTASTAASVAFGVNGIGNGLFAPGGNSVGLAVAGTQRLYIDGTAATISVPTTITNNVTAANFIISGGGSYYTNNNRVIIGQTGSGNVGDLVFASGGNLGWVSSPTTAWGTQDINLSRVRANWLALGTSATSGDSTGNLTANIGAFKTSLGIGTAAPTAVLHLKAGTAAASTAPLKFTTQAAALTTPEQGTMELVGNSLQFTQLVKRRGVAMTQAVILADVVADNTVTETAALITAEHGANYLEVGKSEKITLVGMTSQRNNAASYLKMYIKYGGVTIDSVATPGTQAIAAGSPFELSIYITVRTVGATGTMQINSIFTVDGIAVIPSAPHLVTINTTTAQNTTVTAKWNEANASNLFTLNQGHILCIEPNR